MTDETNRPKTNTPSVDRRGFIGSAAATAGLMIVNPALVRGTSANSDVRVGLLGCGGRGTEDASNLVDTGSARAVALADLFPDQLETARRHFDEIQQAKSFPPLDPKQLFVWPHAYHQNLGSQQNDANVIATPHKFHTIHLQSDAGVG